MHTPTNVKLIIQSAQFSHKYRNDSNHYLKQISVRTKTITLFALDIYKVIVDLAFNHHLIEISSS